MYTLHNITVERSKKKVLTLFAPNLPPPPPPPPPVFKVQNCHWYNALFRAILHNRSKIKTYFIKIR